MLGIFPIKLFFSLSLATIAQFVRNHGGYLIRYGYNLSLLTLQLKNAEIFSSAYMGLTMTYMGLI